MGVLFMALCDKTAESTETLKGVFFFQGWVNDYQPLPADYLSGVIGPDDDGKDYRTNQAWSVGLCG